MPSLFRQDVGQIALDVGRKPVAEVILHMHLDQERITFHIIEQILKMLGNVFVDRRPHIVGSHLLICGCVYKLALIPVRQ